MIKAVIFDCFGVLIGKGFDNTYRKAGGEPNNDREFIENALRKANLGQIHDDQFHSSMANKLGLPLEDWKRAITSAEQINDELLSYILELKKHYKTAVLSNANIGVLEKRIGKDRLNAIFNNIVVSAEVGIVKPDPDIYMILCERLNVKPSECIYVDDRQLFLESADKLGMRTYLYKDFNSCKQAIESELTK